MDEERVEKEWTNYGGAILLTGIPTTVGTQLIGTGLSLTNNTGIIALFMTVSVIVSYLIGLYRYHENFNVFAAIGSILFIVGITVAIKMKNRANNQAKSNS